MYCLKCGNELEDGMRFCNKCGTRVGETDAPAPKKKQAENPAPKAPKAPKRPPEPEPEPEKKKGHFPVVALVVTLVVIAIVAVAVFIGKDYIQSLIDASNDKKISDEIVEKMEAGDYDEAASLYEENYKYNDTPETLIEELTERLNTAWTSYSEGTVTYEEALEEVNAIAEMGESDLEESIQEVVDNIESLEASRTAYDTANSLVEEGDYLGAVEQYALVIETDSNYSDAQTKSEEAVDAYRSEALESAAAYAEDEDYTSAIETINVAMEDLPDDTALAEQLETYTAKLDEQNRASYITAAQEYESNEEYLKAYQSIDSALAEYPDDEELKSLLEDYEAEYVENMLAKAEAKVEEDDFSQAREIINIAINALDTKNSDLQDYLTEINTAEEEYIAAAVEEIIKSAEEYASEKDYEEAISVINTALKEYSGNEALMAELEDLADRQPVKLSSMIISEGEWYELSEDLEEDTTGNYYSGDNLFLLDDGYSSSIGYMEIYLGGEYSAISGVLACHNDAGNGESGVVSFSGDGKLLKVSSTVSRKSTPQEFEIDVTGVDWLTIEWGEGSSGLYIILSDCVLEKE